jgi:tripartite-type tricarboxylate transporter receptor subunit TctC
MPEAVVKRLNEATLKALQDEKVKQQLHALGATIVGSTPQEFGRWIREDLARWAKVVKVAKVEQQ